MLFSIIVFENTSKIVDISKLALLLTTNYLHNGNDTPRSAAGDTLENLWVRAVFMTL